MAAEKDEIAIAIVVFTHKMLEMMSDKHDEGFRGWDDPVYQEEILDRLRNKVQQPFEDLRPKDFIHIANWAMMLYGFKDEDEGSANRH